MVSKGLIELHNNFSSRGVGRDPMLPAPANCLAADLRRNFDYGREQFVVCTWFVVWVVIRISTKL